MAIVEDEVRNESEEENEIEVVVEEDDADQDSDDSDDDDEEVLEKKVHDLLLRIEMNPYQYDDHIDLIRAYWSMSELDRWRAAFERLQQLSVLRAEHWLLRLQTEMTLSHSKAERENLVSLFEQACLDCYSIPILSEWCHWSLTGETPETRAQIEEVLRRAGADPLSGKIFWDAKLELEKTQLETMSANDPEFLLQQERVLFCLEETVSRPLIRGEEAWTPLSELAAIVKDNDYIDKIKKQHEAATDYLKKISPYEDKLLTIDNADEKCSVYQEYIDTVKALSQDDRYVDCDSNGILKVLYDRATTECMSCAAAPALLSAWARHVRACSSRTTCARVLTACTRRRPASATFWLLSMQQAERDGKTFDEVKAIFETALSKGMESYKEAESLWMGYLEFMRRRTAFDSEDDVERLRRTFRLAWDSLAEAWGEAANDCEVPLYWARLEYRRTKDHRQGKEIIEEIFKYGENKTMSKYWEALITLESNRDPPPSENKLRDMYRRALKFTTDYPPAVVRLWTDFERDVGQLDTARECYDACETKIKEWKDSYQAMKDKMTGQKQKGKLGNKKSKYDKQKAKDQEKPKKGKRKAEEQTEGDAKKKKEDTALKEKEGVGVKRRKEDGGEVVESKRQRTDSGSSNERLVGRDACTLFVSNLEFKVDEQKLRDELSKYGDIVSMRVRSGVKAFGGSICYCQYKAQESVDEALNHDRSPLEGRPMFFSRYSSKNQNSKPSFKYSTTAEENKLFVKNLPHAVCTKEALTNIFDKYGKLVDVRVVTFKDGKPKGLAYIEYEDKESAANALSKTDNLLVGDRNISVAISAPPKKQSDSLGQPKRDPTGGMRRTQLSQFVPSSVLQRASTSASASAPTGGATGSTASTSKQTVTNGNAAPTPDKRPLSNTDFRNMLLNK